MMLQSPKAFLITLGGMLTALLAMAVVAVLWLNVRGEDALPAAEDAFTTTPALVVRGEYLARAGNCAACHTARGGVPFAGGRAIETPFGTVYGGNLTPDPATGLGRWTASEFWRALHNGRSRDGRLLAPVFPYTNFTQVTRDDSDALFAFLRSLPPVVQAPVSGSLRFPYNTQAALAVWRALYFSPRMPTDAHQEEATRSPEWRRGAYLVRGLGHCNACHASRNALGATSGSGPLEFGGGLIPMQGWYAPSLSSAEEAGVADWPVQEVVSLLQHGVSGQASALGPMAEVVFRSTQHLSAADLKAMAVFLKSLPPTPPAASRRSATVNVDLAKGRKLYEKQCADCHGLQGEGAVRERLPGGPLAYPALAGNRAVTMAASTNLVRVIRSGGIAPATVGNPRPYSMPPFDLGAEDLAAVVSYIRSSWGNQAAPVSAAEVLGAQ